MQENNFEKEVRQKMEELQFTPSEPVWQKVALQIRRKRERRRLLLLLPLLIIGSGLTWYFITHTLNAPMADTIVQPEPQHKALPQTKESKPVLQEGDKNKAEGFESDTYRAGNTLGRGNNQVVAAKPLQKEKQTFSKPSATTVSKADATVKQPDVEEEVMPPLPAIPKRKNKNLPGDLHAFVLEQEIKKLDATQQQNENVSNSFRDSSKREQTVIAPIAKDADAPSGTKDSAAIAAVVADKEDTASNAVAQPLLVKKGEEKKKWSYTANVRIGSSGLRSQFPMFQTFSQDRSADFSSNPIPSSGSNNNNAPGLRAPSVASNGFAFSAGAGLRQHLFKNTYVNAGLQYSQYTQRISVGELVSTDTTMLYSGRLDKVSGYYRSGSQNHYTSRYHYLELPVSFEYRLFKKVPLQVQHGASAGYLFKSNALYYNRTAAILFQSDEWQRKWGLQLFTSLDYRLLQKGNLQWFAGPQLQWGLTPLQNNSETQKHHLFFAGMQTRIAF